jgi:hypothetical protein
MKKLLTVLLVSAMTIAIAGCATTADSTEIPETTLSPPRETTPKFVGSSYLMFPMMGFPTFDDFVLDTLALSENIVIGSVDSIYEVIEQEFYEYEEGAPPPPTFFMTYYNIIVEQTLLGEELDELLVGMLGTPDNEIGMTKPPVGSRVVLFAGRGNDPEGRFYSISFEKGVFIINDDDTLYSLHDDEMVAQFDGQPLGVLISEIERILDNGEFSREFMATWIEEAQAEHRERVRKNREQRQRQSD